VAGTITTECLIGGSPFGSLVTNSGSALVVESAAFDGLSVAALTTLGFRASMDASLDASGLEALHLLVELR
jgi:hypothetical protein